jgi:hypothetical protein
VQLISPNDTYVSLISNQSFVCDASDWQLANITFYLWDNSSRIYRNKTREVSGTFNESIFNLTNLPFGDYTWNCLGVDKYGNFKSSPSNFSLTIGEVRVDLISPEDESFTNTNSTFSCNFSSDSSYELKNASFKIWNASNSLFSKSKNISKSKNQKDFNYSFPTEGVYKWTCVAYNNNSNKGSTKNYSITFDKTDPIISYLSSSVTSNSATLSWTTLNDASNASINLSAGEWTDSDKYTENHSIFISGLSSSTFYTYTILSCDKANNCVTSSGSLTTKSKGGSSGSSSKIKKKEIVIGNNDLWSGKSKSLKKGEVLSFKLTSGKHSLNVEEIGKDFAKVVIRSNPTRLRLNVGDKILVNLSSSSFYDLVVGLSGISNGEANISVKRIFELINKTNAKINNKSNEENKTFHTMGSKTNTSNIKLDWIKVFEIIILIVLIFLILQKDEDVKKCKKKKMIKRGEEKEFRKKLKRFGIKV